MKTRFLLLPLLLLIAGCGASIDPLLQGKINTYFTQKSSDTFAPAGKFYRPIQYAIGQWVLYANTCDGKRSVSKMSIVGQEGKGWIIENYSLTESSETTIQMLVTGLDKFSETYHEEDIEFVWVKIKMKDKDEAQTIEGPALSIVKSLYRKGILNYSLNLSAMMDGGTVSTLAGTFIKTTKATSEIDSFGGKNSTDAWFHQEVPINGMVKSAAKDGSSASELISFGKTGARKSF